MKLHHLSLLGAVVVIAALTGCGGNGNEPAKSAANSSATRPIVKTITIKETEYKLTPSAVSLAKTGTYELKIVNNGSVSHALEVEPGGDEVKSEEIGPGESRTIDVTFKDTGSFEMYCPVDGHKDLGMKGDITVGSGGGAGGGTTTEGTTTTQTDTGGGGY